MKLRFQYLDKSGAEVAIGNREALREYIMEGRVEGETLLHDSVIGLWAPASMHAAFTRVHAASTRVSDPLVHRDARIDLEMPVELRCEDSAYVFLGRSINLSQSGMLVLAGQDRPRGTLVRFEFGLGLSGLAEIIWMGEADAGGTLLGLKFHSVRRDAREILLGLLRMPPHPEPSHPPQAGLERDHELPAHTRGMTAKQQYRTQRVYLELDVDLVFGDSTEAVPGRVVNVSGMGLLVRAQDARPAGTQVRFELDGQLGGGLGEIVWTREVGSDGFLIGISLRREDREVLIRALGY